MASLVERGQDQGNATRLILAGSKRSSICLEWGCARSHILISNQPWREHGTSQAVY